MIREKKIRYSEVDLNEFKDIIRTKIRRAKQDLFSLKESFGNSNGTNDTSPQFKSFEDSVNIMAREANIQLANRQEKFIRDLKNALVRIENKTYGICRKTGHLIQKERLKLVPHATLSIIAKRQQ